MKRTTWGPHWDPWNDRERRDEERRRRRARAEKAAQLIRRHLGDGFWGRSLSRIAKVLLEMDPPGPMRDP
jgi:hypothetical protein